VDRGIERGGHRARRAARTEDDHLGGARIEVEACLERQPLALEPADASDLGSLVRGHESPSLVAFRYKAIAGHDPRSLAVRVSRYATQAMQVANVDEARYQVLIVEDGKSMVKAPRGAQQPSRPAQRCSAAGRSRWQASVAGRPVRPGRSSEGALDTIEARSREDLPPFVVEISTSCPR
jgi:hypothetical protein